MKKYLDIKNLIILFLACLLVIIVFNTHIFGESKESVDVGEENEMIYDAEDAEEDVDCVSGMEIAGIGEEDREEITDQETLSMENLEFGEGEQEPIRQPAKNEWGDRTSYDPDDTIYYKSVYDHWRDGILMHIDYSPVMEIREELTDYFPSSPAYGGLKYLAGMFYDNRTIEMDEKELEQLYWERGYYICFHRAEYGEYHLRLIEITEVDGLSLYPSVILMQTWDDQSIYLQGITAPIPRKVRDLMVVDRDGTWQIIMHSSGVSADFVSEEELSFWEFYDGYWILVPMELEIDTSHAYIMGDLCPELDRDGLFEVSYYRDGIAYRPSVQNDFHTDITIRLGSMTVVKENKVFRLNAVYEGAYGRTVEDEGCYIEYTIK